MFTVIKQSHTSLVNKNSIREWIWPTHKRIQRYYRGLQQFLKKQSLSRKDKEFIHVSHNFVGLLAGQKCTRPCLAAYCLFERLWLETKIFENACFSSTQIRFHLFHTPFTHELLNTIKSSNFHSTWVCTTVLFVCFFQIWIRFCPDTWGWRLSDFKTLLFLSHVPHHVTSARE